MLKTVLQSLLYIFIIVNTAHSQLWKAYADTAASAQKNSEAEKAVKYYLLANSLLEKDSVNTVTYANTTYTIGALYQALYDYKNAESYLLRSRDLRKSLGKERTPEYARCCNSLGSVYTAVGNYNEAERFYLEGKNTRESLFGKNHRDYAASCNSAGLLYYTLGQYEKAEALLLESKSILENLLGPDDMANARPYNNLGNLYQDIGAVEKAEHFYLLANKILEKNLGPKDPDYLGNTLNVGSFYEVKGEFNRAEEFYTKAYNNLKELEGGKHPYHSIALDNLGSLYWNWGDYDKAEDFLLKSWKLMAAEGNQTPEFAINLQHLGLLYNSIGQFNKSLAYYQECKKIREAIFEKDHPSHIQTYSNLAILYYGMNDLKRSIQYFTSARELIEKLAGKEYPEYISVCVNMGIVYQEQGDTERALNLYKEALLLREKIYGKEDPYYSIILANLAGLFMETGDYSLSEQHYKEAILIFEMKSGVHHEDYAMIVGSMADLYWNWKKPALAKNYFKQYFNAKQVLLRDLFYFTNESEKEKYLRQSSLGEESYSFYLEHYPEQAGDAYNLSFITRNAILQSGRQLKTALINSGDTMLLARYYHYTDLKNRLGDLYSKPQVDKSEIQKVEAETETSEKELARLSIAFRKQKESVSASWKDIQSALKVDEAAIEFTSFSYYDGFRWTDSLLYAAILMRKDWEEPRMIRLFEQKSLDSVLNFRSSSPGPQKIAALYNGNLPATKKTSLYDLVWKPIEGKLSGIRTIYLAPSGSLYKIAFAAIPVERDSMLSDRYRLIQLNSTAGILDPAPGLISTTDSLFLYGGIQYDADSAAMRLAIAKNSSNDLVFRSLPPDLETEKAGSFFYLKGAAEELNAIAGLAKLKNRPFHKREGLDATEESLRTITGNSSHSILHLATHGFFFKDPVKAKLNTVTRLEGADVFKQSENPLIRSGIVMAGANNAWKGKPVKGVQDGIVTAYEIATLYLPNTKLAVLSACETGLGDIQGSEGVYGLQRSFRMAGVQNLVMSLWKVPDNETAEFMKDFYKNLFEGLTIGDAFFSTQEKMKDKYRNEPYKWAAWILVR